MPSLSDTFPGPAPETPACPCWDSEWPCVCDQVERALRAWGAGTLAVPMTPEQRAWCFEEIRSVEGADDPGDSAADRYVASAVLFAWQDFARDKGLIP